MVECVLLPYDISVPLTSTFVTSSKNVSVLIRSSFIKVTNIKEVKDVYQRPIRNVSKTDTFIKEVKDPNVSKLGKYSFTNGQGRRSEEHQSVGGGPAQRVKRVIYLKRCWWIAEPE